MAKRVKHSGVGFEGADGTPNGVIVPALTAGQVEALSPILVQHDAVAMTDFSGVAQRLVYKVQIIKVALLRNYPDITDEQVNEFVTMENSDAIFKAALGVDRTSARIKEMGEPEPVTV